MKTLPPAVTAIALCCCLVVGTADAGIITFNGHAGEYVENVGEFIDVGGFRFTLTANISQGHLNILDQDDIGEPGTKLLIANHTELTMTKVGGGEFDFFSVDIGGGAIYAPLSWADHVEIASDAGTVAVNLPTGSAYQSATLNFLNVTSVSFKPFANADPSVYGPNAFTFVVDNIEVDSDVPDPPIVPGPAIVPEPASLALWGLAAFGIATGWRRRSAGNPKK